MKHKVYLGLGSNLGESKEILKQALRLIADNIGSVSAVSKLYVSTALNPETNPEMQQNDYYNMAVICESELDAEIIYDKVHFIENLLGLDRKNKLYWGPRIIDIDTLAIDNMKISLERLRVPHPEIENRDFVLLPLKDIDPNFHHPISGKSVEEMIEILKLKSDRAFIKDVLPAIPLSN